MLKYIISLFFITLLFVPLATYADNPHLPVRDARYAARYVTQNIPDPVVLEAGATRDVTFTFRNTGTATWQTTGAYATAYTVDPRYRTSAFANHNWINATNPGKFAAPVAPGETGTLTVSLTAPQTPGMYTEEFYLAANSHSWMANGYFYIKIQVVPATNATIPAPQPVEAAPEPPVPATNDTSSAIGTPEQISRFYISRQQWEVAGGEAGAVRVSYKNISDTPLTNLRLVPIQMRDVMFAHPSWQSGQVIAAFPDIAPDAAERTDITIASPTKAGNYAFAFALASDEGVLRGSEFRMDVTVTTDAPVGYHPPLFATPANPITYRYDAEPTIRVGLAKIDTGSMTFMSLDDDYRLVRDGEIIALIPKATEATLSYTGSVYRLTAPGIAIESPEYLRLEPTTTAEAVFTLDGGFARDITWQGRRTFTTYRGIVELRRADDRELTLYAINELPLDAYTAGVAEVGNTAPTEFLKAQAIAARTYAHVIQGTRKYPDRYFDIVAHTADQLYLGVGIEEMTPNYLAATRATRGEIVTYDTVPALTPYYANSDGTTRGFHEVWGGAVRPWLISVSTEHDLGRTRFGHGVGMSQRDAMARATAGALYTDILAHYYSGVEVERMYE